MEEPTTSPTTTTPIPLPHPFTNTHPTPKILTLGAEAHIYKTHFLTPSTPCILKYRPPKAYRHPTLDARLTRHRILSEARTLVKCRREGVSVPGVLALGAEEGWMMEEWVAGRTVKSRLWAWRDWCRRRGEGGMGEEVLGLMGRIGRAVGGMHEIGVVHGDLTTSNLMLKEDHAEGLAVNGNGGNGSKEEEINREGGIGREGKVDLEGEIVLIDFGLAGQSIQDEDKAVDLYVLERAFGSTHPDVEDGFQEVLRAYGESYKGARVVLKRLEEVRMRGRKKSMIG